LYGRRVEARTLKEMVEILGRLERDGLGSLLGLAGNGMEDQDRAEGEGGPKGDMEADAQETNGKVVTNYDTPP
jgi:hypothetical protein